MYKVTVQPSGHSFSVEQQENLLDAGLRQGIALPYSCRSGSCGACMVTIKQGAVDYPQGEPLALSSYDMEQGRALLCQAIALSDVEIDCPQVGELSEIEVKTLPVRVEKLRKLNPDVIEMTLKLPANERLRFMAGQYIDLLLRDGKRRSFSIANAPTGDTFIELHIRHVPNGHFTSHVFNDMKEKALLRMQGPLGSFYIRELTHPVILVGGGTGFAPLKSMLEYLKLKGFDQAVYLYWGVRSKEDLYMDYLPRDWMNRYPQFKYIPVLSEPKPEDQWQGRTGWVHDAVVADFPDLTAYQVYMSGPPPMIIAGREAFLARGLRAEHLYSDSFDYSPDTLKALAEKQA